MQRAIEKNKEQIEKSLEINVINKKNVKEKSFYAEGLGLRKDLID
jgi:hypothetical protein